MPPRSSKPPPPSEDNETSALRHELELSTFLNKGVLQNNTELKVRIHELERENKALRAAESNLADIEARLEDAEKRAADLEQEVQEREAELNDREGEMEEKIRDALMAKKGLERENRQLREEMKSWREIGAGVIKRMGVAGLVKFERPAEGVAGDAELVGTGDEVQARGTKRTAVGTAKSAATDSKATDRVVKRDVPRQRSTPRDAPPSAEEQSDVEGAAVKAEPVHRGYRTRTTGPAPAVLRGDLRTTASTSKATPTRAPQTGRSAANANRKRSRQIDSDTVDDSAEEHVHQASVNVARAGRAKKMRADIPRTERDEVCCSGDDEDDVGLDDQGPGDEEEEDEEEETLEEGEDVEDRSTEPDAGSLDRSPTPLPAPRANAARIRPSPNSSARPGASSRHAPGTGTRNNAKATTSKPADSTRTSRPSSPRSINISGKAPSRPTANRHQSRPDPSSRIPKPVKRSTVGASSSSVKPERETAGPRAVDDHWGQPIIVKKERFSLSPDPEEEEQRKRGYAGGYDPHDAYDTDDDPLAADM